MKHRIAIVTAVLALSATAQDVITEREQTVVLAGPPKDHIFLRQGVVEGAIAGAPTVEFMAAEMIVPGKPASGAPYSAEAITETSQTLADGNRIVRKTTAQVYRDSEGRTRREESLPAIGPWAAAGEAPRTIFIHDPVAKVSYVLQPAAKTARKLPVPEFKQAGAVAGFRFGNERLGGGPVAGAVFERAVPAPAPFPSKTEPLGKRVIEGVTAEGTRVTVTIPAGAIGNERPIETVAERWFSPELQEMLLTRRSDPRFGETVYRLTSIQRIEPLRSLFEVPPDYTIVEANHLLQKMKPPAGERE